MSKTAMIFLLVLAIGGCDRETDVPGETESSSAKVEFRGKTYQLAVVSECKVKSDGSYGVWAFTLDANGEPIPDATHLHALSEEDWSVIDIYVAEDEQIVRIYRDGSEKFGFENGILGFEGALGAGLTEQARVRIVCSG